MDVYCHPLDRWDGPVTEHRRRSTFTARWTTTISDLEAEAAALGSDEVLILLDLERSQIRVDGWPKSQVDVPPMVAVAFESRHGPLRFQCDQWATWKENVRAIGLTLQRLRLIDEGGVARSGEQYRGWAAIGPGSGPTTREQAIAVLELYAGGNADGESRSWQDLYRRAVKNTHPDRGVNTDDFLVVQKAKQILLAGGS